MNISIEGNATEVNDLSSGISKMKDSIRDKINDIQIINTSYERFVPKEFLTLLEKRTIIDVGIGDSASKKMSVLFSDMRDFTSISENLTPNENFAFLNQYLDAMTPAVNSNNGFIDKYIGDAIMALFPTCADDAVTAAIEMNKNLFKFNLRENRDTQNSISMGIGIHIGELVIGTIGRETRMETTVISDTVNASARLENLNKVYHTNLLISGEVYDELSDRLRSNCRLIDRTRVKGKKESLDVFEVFATDQKELYDVKLQSKKKLEVVVGTYLTGNVEDAIAKFKEIQIYGEVDPVIAFWNGRLKSE